MPEWIWILVAGINLFAFLLFGWDKWRAGRSGSRIREMHLLLLVACSGVVGAYLGSQLFRHKTRKVSFRIKFALAAAVNLLWLWLWWRGRGA